MTATGAQGLRAALCVAAGACRVLEMTPVSSESSRAESGGMVRGRSRLQVEDGGLPLATTASGLTGQPACYHVRYNTRASTDASAAATTLSGVHAHPSPRLTATSSRGGR